MNQFHAFFRGIILVGFALLLIKLIVSEKLANFISPKMHIYVYIALFIFLLLGFILILSSSSEKNAHQCGCAGDHNVPKTIFGSIFVYSLFIFPLVTGFLFSDHILTNDAAIKRGHKYGEGIFSSTSNGNPPSDPNLTSLEAKKIILLTNENFLPVLDQIERNLQHFVGKKVQLEGFVYREPDFTKDQIVVARFGVSCCTADAVVFGMAANGNSLQSLPNDTWIRVKGTIDVLHYNDSELPVIVDPTIEKIDPPSHPYVYDTYEQNE
ncbi:TIGR03943 family protein [Bacillus gobiensis]|uniref:TIGR03943 family putative permease subunit n=1 Tax=Bacillus gobiensis TaxID=1441095 RepID=UPI003D1FD3DD